MSHKNNFNLLRIIAALLVAVTHSFAVTGHSLQEPFYQLTKGSFYFSSAGLYIFFFTSGYLVTRSATDSATPLIYLQKRILRIYPALICVVFISVFIAGPMLTSLSTKNYFTDATTWKYLWTATGLKIRFMLPGVFDSNKFFMSGFNGSLWSIQLELEMYALLFIFLLAKVFTNKKKLLTFLFFSIAAITFFIITNQYFFLIADRKNALLACTFLLGGIVQTKIFNDKILLGLLMLSAIFIVLKVTGLIKTALLFDEVIFFSLLSYFIAFSKYFTVNITTDISYGVYIYTFPLQQFIFESAGFVQSPFVNLIFSLCCSFVLALLSWKCIEKPALAYKKQLKKADNKTKNN